MKLGPEGRWIGRLDLERVYVSSLLSGARVDGVGPSHFVDPNHKEIVSVVRELQEAGRPVDTTLVVNSLRQRGASAGGRDWGVIVAGIIDAPSAGANLPEYARRIAAYASIETVRSTLGELVSVIDAPGGTIDPVSTLDLVNATLHDTLDGLPQLKPLLPLSSSEILAAAEEPLQWVLRPLLTAGGVRLISGPGKVTKTTFLIAALVRAITGGWLAEQFEAEGGHTVVWFDAENTKRSWSKKFVAVCQGLGVDARSLLDSERFLYINRRGLYLDDPSLCRAVIDAVKGAHASEVVLDSLTRIHRQKESDAVAMSSFFVDSIFRLRDKAQVGITIPHHTRKGIQGLTDDPASALRGTGDLRNVVDTHLSLTREKRDRSLFTLTVTAQRDAPEEGPFRWRLEWPQGMSARFLPIRETEVNPGSQPGRPPRKATQAADLLRKALAGDPDLPRVKGIELCKVAGIGETTAKAAWKEIRRG